MAPLPPDWQPALAALEALGASDEPVAGLARLQSVAWRHAADERWGAGLPPLDPRPLDSGRPLLDGRDLLVGGRQLSVLLQDLAAAAARSKLAAAETAAGALATGAVDGAAVLAAELSLDRKRMAALAAGGGLEPGPLTVLANLAAIPLLQACGRAARDELLTGGWRHGWCPVCAAWPLLAEARGEDRGRWLHCGRCGTTWRHSHLECSFCGEAKPRLQGYLAVEREGEARRANFCLRCDSYLKSVASPGALAPPAAALADLRTLDLDLAALERGYARPDHPSAPARLCVRLV
ncbi:MAG: hypothetical protein ACYC4L_17025 [Chloroflexota bacterium]